ncbi:hypothetical protein ADK65_02490 [Streptomyces sp. NRRL B-1140]|uniref:hypothetical protein n=1 Tax=Streptomyces sp. NRRL B-1140 TaxID=1415549 RepID=UPI0006AEA598|nr:hypothetical protein [Streptomyces sp. NRRL B-1140]KOX06098.1 hypothetical protein ADK65_02490 [Streptomyces sp. NRRL B-1140]
MMRKHIVTDILTTLIVAAVVVPFIGYSVRGSMPFVQDPRGMAGVGIVGCLLLFLVLRGGTADTGRLAWLTWALGALALGFGITTLIAETSWALLVPMMAALVAFWAAVTVQRTEHAGPARSVTRA